MPFQPQGQSNAGVIKNKKVNLLQDPNPSPDLNPIAMEPPLSENCSQQTSSIQPEEHLPGKGTYPNRLKAVTAEKDEFNQVQHLHADKLGLLFTRV